MIAFFESFLPKGFRANQSLSIAYRHSVFTANLAKVIAQNAGLDATKDELLSTTNPYVVQFINGNPTGPFTEKQ